MPGKDANGSDDPPSSTAVRTNHVAPIRIREMEIDDLAAVFHLGEELFKAENVQSLYRTWDEYEVVDLFNSDGEFCLVAEEEDEIVGFALGTTIEKWRSAWNYGHLIWLGVRPGRHRRGVGEKLFRRFRDVMVKNGVRMLLVDTAADNEQALRFFAKMGFGSPQDHVYLSLNLSKKQGVADGSGGGRSRSRD